MVLSRLRLPCALSLALTACLGRAASGEDTGGAGAAGMATTASGGAPVKGGHDSSGGAGADSDSSTTIPHPSEREKELLAPLETDDATIDATSGTELLALGRSVGLAKA